MTAVRKIKGYGWKPDIPDHRDRIFNRENKLQPWWAIPKTVDLTSHMPPVYDQGQLGSCTGNGWAAVMEYMAARQGEPMDTPSRLFIYYEERVIEGSVDQDAGAEIRDGAKVVANKGVPPETDWPYDIGKFADKPPQQAYTDALKHEALVYKRVQVGPGAPMRNALAAGFPIVIGFSVPDYFEGSWDPTSTPLPVPGPDANIIGGHCVVLAGYDFSETRFKQPAFLARNSWGSSWGDSGYFWFDWRWFTADESMASDMWIVEKVE
jgi:C1A family cysteine protease